MTSRQLARFFTPVVRTRGRQYAQDGAVKAVRAMDGVLRAVVTGSRPHDVELEMVGGRLRATCACPYARTSGACKHVWATILDGERSGHLFLLTAANERPRTGAKEHRWGWRDLLDLADVLPPALTTSGPKAQDLIYAVDVPRVLETGNVTLQVLRRNASDPAAAPEPLRLRREQIPSLPEAEDRALLSLLRDFAAETPHHWEQLPARFELPQALVPTLLSAAARAERLHILTTTGELSPKPVTFDDGPPWELGLAVSADGDKDDQPFIVEGKLHRGNQAIDLSAPLVLTRTGWVVLPDRVARLHHAGLFELLARLRDCQRIPVLREDGAAFVGRLYSLPALPRLTLPASLALTERTVSPTPSLVLTVPRTTRPGLVEPVLGTLSFVYDGETVGAADPRACVVRLEARQVLPRLRADEEHAASLLEPLGFRQPTGRPDLLHIATGRVASAVRSLVAKGWRVEANGKLYRRPGRFDLSVSSGIDWFDVTATLAFDDVPVPLPALLAAARGDGIVRLDDGSVGVLPEDWLARHGLLARLGAPGPDGTLRFRRSQATLLDLLVATEPDARVDEVFARARRELAAFDRIQPQAAPRGFRGTLRPYQELGLGWMAFLRRFGFGGCLADDMGLGKTVQVLAMLASRRREGAGTPSLIVVPKSLVSNWVAEARRFAPRLRVLAHVGMERTKDARAFEAHDVVLTTYGTLKNDVQLLCGVAFDYVILDEAQAIKNSASVAAKAARLLHGSHRLALTGTPVENHLGELWSLIEFLNPGLVGRLGLPTGRDRQLPAAEVATMARALRPFILRRTKAQVTPELPVKHEETLVCDMEPAQRRLYQELRDHFRTKVLAEVDLGGMSRARMHVLEALLRLRQAACHPGLVDRKRAGEPSAKLDVLVERLQEVVAEGHKALVFSQFTSLLALVKTRLDAAGLVYEYLDGKTQDRALRVARFQGDQSCPVFLLSLKAGGVGLNLTAADYVFILDPWWNPAVEAQAVDRAHRIGQSKRVFAYRLLCRDTVEEKIATLQHTKRALAEAIVTADEGFIRRMDRGTLESLLS